MAKSGWDKWKEKKARKARSDLKRSLKKAGKIYAFVIISALLVGIAGGYFGLEVICKNDAFEIKGEREITLTETEAASYTDAGIKYISIGLDLSKDVKVEGLPVSENGKVAEGKYPIIYTAVGGRCDGKTLYRVITVTLDTSKEG